MSVESLCLSSDARLVNRWWQQPLAATIADLRSYNAGERPTHPYLVDSALDEFIAALQAAQPVDQSSLSRRCATLVATLANAAGQQPSLVTRLRGLFGEQVAAGGETLRELGGLIDWYVSLLEIARQGPFAPPADVRPTDSFLAQYLAAFLPADQAARYDATIPAHTRGPCLPPELRVSSPQLFAQVEPWIGNTCYVLDAAEYQGIWAQIERIDNFWPNIAREVSAPALAHLRAVGEVARYANEHGLVMLKLFR